MTELTALAFLIAAVPLKAQDSSRVRDSLPRQVGERVDPSDSARSLTRIIVRAARPRAGYAAHGTYSATKTDLPLRDVPQAVTVIASELLADQSAQSMSDVVRYIPGITMGQGEGHRDAPTIRGNSSTADFFVDGVRDDAQYMRDLYNVDRVEALKGPNAMVFGRGGGGGVLNRVTKEAQWTPKRSIAYESGSWRHNRATVDLGEALTRSLAVRVNGMLESTGDFRDATQLERQGINPTAALIVGGTLLRLGYEHFADRRTVNRGLPSFGGRPSDAKITTFFGDPDASQSRVAVHSVGTTLERGSLERVMVRNRSLFAAYDKFYSNVYPGAVNQAGTEVSLSAYNNTIDRRNLFNQTDITFARGSGRLRQLFLVGAELGRQTTDSYRSTGYFTGNATTLNVPFDRPTVSAPVTFRRSASDADHRMTAGTSAIYAQEQIAFGSHWQAVAGVRLERFEVLFHDNRNSRELFRADRMLSPRFGLVFKPFEAMSIYGSHGASSLPSAGDQFGSLSPTTSALEPERFTNRELGAKWDLPSGLSVTGAVYRLDRSNSAAPNPVDPGRSVQTGRQRTTGAEAALSGAISNRWEVSGGYAWQHARILSRTTSATAGATVPLVPYYTLSLWNRYRVSPWLAAGLGVVRQDEMFAAIDNAVTLPAFTRLDWALFATPHQRIRAQLNVENVLNTRYYPTSHGNNNILPGAPRTLRISVTAAP